MFTFMSDHSAVGSGFPPFPLTPASGARYGRTLSPSSRTTCPSAVKTRVGIFMIHNAG